MFGNYSFLRLFSIFACLLGGTFGLEAIVGGDIVHRVDDFGYQATVMIDDDEAICGGGIIDDKFVLTAVHCALMQDGYLRAMRMSILVGTIDKYKQDDPAVLVRVAQIYVPIEYNPKKRINPGLDIAVLKLDHSLKLSTRPHLRKLNLPHDSMANYSGKSGLIAGFGYDWFDAHTQLGGHSDSKLRFAEVDVLTRCNKRYFRNVDGIMCAQVKQYDYSRQRGVCHEDSGAPIVYEGTAIGILSFCYNGCSENIFGSFYTSVSHHLKFIAHAMDYENNKYHWDIQEYHLH